MFGAAAQKQPKGKPVQTILGLPCGGWSVVDPDPSIGVSLDNRVVVPAGRDLAARQLVDGVSGASLAAEVERHAVRQAWG
jgi:hypothetical protein